jgi:hypothetical protein
MSPDLSVSILAFVHRSVASYMGEPVDQTTSDDLVKIARNYRLNSRQRAGADGWTQR